MDTVLSFLSHFFFIGIQMLENSNNKAFRWNDKVIDNLSSFKKIYRFSAVQQIDPFLSHSLGDYNFSDL